MRKDQDGGIAVEGRMNTNITGYVNGNRGFYIGNSMRMGGKRVSLHLPESFCRPSPVR